MSFAKKKLLPKNTVFQQNSTIWLFAENIKKFKNKLKRKRKPSKRQMHHQSLRALWKIQIVIVLSAKRK